MKDLLKRFLSGLSIGFGAAIPGVSGGTIAVIIGNYHKILHSVSNIFKEFKKSFLYLLPILLGVILAFIPCILLFDMLFEGMLFAIVCIFAGLIIGSMPKILDDVKGKEVTKKEIITLIVCLIIALSIGVGSALLEDVIDLNSYFVNTPFWFYLIMIPIGVLASTALVVPGISGSMLLFVLGFYKPMINSLSLVLKGESTNVIGVIGIFGCCAVGIIIGFLLISKLMHYLLNKYHLVTMYGIIGFIIGSTMTLFYNNTIANYYSHMFITHDTWMPNYVEIILGAALLIIFTILSYLLIRYIRKKEQTDGLGN